MYCPIQKDHKMVEVAPGLFQCPKCGYGPSQHGYRPYWALSQVHQEESLIEATCVRFEESSDSYVMVGLSWAIDRLGKKIEDTVEEDSMVVLTERELPTAALPVVIRAKGKWDYPPNKPTLTSMMYEDSQGPKEIALSRAPRRRS